MQTTTTGIDFDREYQDLMDQHRREYDEARADEVLSKTSVQA